LERLGVHLLHCGLVPTRALNVCRRLAHHLSGHVDADAPSAWSNPRRGREQNRTAPGDWARDATLGR